MLISTGPFDLSAGDNALVAMAILFGRAPDGTTSLSVDEITFRPNPNDPILAELLDTQANVRSFYETHVSGKGLAKKSAGIVQQGLVPSEFVLSQNHPNPFNPGTALTFSMPEGAPVSLIVYDLAGREVARLRNGFVDAGYHQVYWDGSSADGGPVPSGIYIARMVTPGFTRSQKMLLLK